VPALVIQIQADRNTDIDLAAIREQLDALTSQLPEISELQIVEGEDNGTYINYSFETQNVNRLWQVLRHQFYNENTNGLSLGPVSIVTCEGPHGWDDYLLLHHFDTTLALDSLPEP
jgi:hypothetical protein